MSAEIAGFASKWRTQRRSRGEQRDHGTAGIARRPEPRLSFIQDVRTGRVSGKCRLNRASALNADARQGTEMPHLPRFKPLAKSLASFVIPSLGTVHGYDNPLGTLSAASCYSIFLRHITLLREAGVTTIPRVVAELGPGSSHGTGFAALIAGAETYYALDIIDFADRGCNLAIFDELAALFRARAPIPATGLHALRFPDLASYDFPNFLPPPPRARVRNPYRCHPGGHRLRRWPVCPRRRALDRGFGRSTRIDRLDRLSIGPRTYR
jgi:hypothetical protein